MKIYAVLVSTGFGQGCSYPKRYYLNKTEALKDAEGLGSDAEFSSIGEVKEIKVIE